MRPKGWHDQFLLNWLYDEVNNLRNREVTSDVRTLVDVVNTLATRVSELEAELTRLEMTKADRRGRKPKIPAQAVDGDS